jgi:HlyD family secretion protein
MTRKKSPLLYTTASVALVILWLEKELRINRNKWSGALSICLILLLITCGCADRSAKNKMVYKTDTAFVSTVVKKTVAAGAIVPRKQVAVKAQVSGIIEKVYVTAGEVVSAGQLLARIRLTPNAVDLNEAESALQKAKLSLNDARHEKERYEQLFAEKVVAEKEYNQYLLVFKKAEADLASAVNNVQLIKVGASASGIAANEVRSTVNGVLLEVPAKEGNFVIERNTFNEGTTIASIADMKDVIFEGKVEEADVNNLQPGMDLSITLRATEEKSYRARLEFVSPNGVKEDGVTKFEIKAAILLDKTDVLRAGYSANAEIVLEKRDNVLCIRENVLQFDQQGAYVEVETKPQLFEKRYVQLGLSDDINTQVLTGLKPQERLKMVF